MQISHHARLSFDGNFTRGTCKNWPSSNTISCNVSREKATRMKDTRARGKVSPTSSKLFKMPVRTGANVENSRQTHCFLPSVTRISSYFCDTCTRENIPLNTPFLTKFQLPFETNAPFSGTFIFSRTCIKIYNNKVKIRRKHRVPNMTFL